MGLGPAAATLARVATDLSRAWRQTSEHWVDSKRVEFEKQYVTGLLTDLRTASKSVVELDRLMMEIRTDCEE